MSHLPITARRFVFLFRFLLFFTLWWLPFEETRAQNVGINNETPLAGLHMISNNGLILSGTFGQGLAPQGGYETKMMWNSRTGSFRTGRITDADGGMYESWWTGLYTGDYSFASGVNCKANGYASSSFGEKAQAIGESSFVAGGNSNIAGGDWSFTSGYENQAPSFAEFVIGANATLYTPVSPGGFDVMDRLFVVGNGQNNSNRHNAMTVLKNGNTGIGLDAPEAPLHIVGLTILDQGRLQFNNTGGSVFIGQFAGENDDWNDHFNVFIGQAAGQENTDGDENIAIGKSALSSASSPNGQIALGARALENNTSGGSNVAIGYESQQNSTGGNLNTALGHRTLASLISSAGNVAIGAYAMESNQHGDLNVSIGKEAWFTDVDGSRNVVIGGNAGQFGEGEDNVLIGYESGRNLQGEGNVFLGNYSGKNSQESNTLVIENSDTSTPLIYGNFATNKVTIHDSLESKYFQMTNGAVNGRVLVSDAAGHGQWTAPSAVFSDDWNSNAGHIYNANTLNVGIGLTNPTEPLHVNGNMRLNAGRLKITGTGHSVFIGQDAGLADDLSDNNGVFIGYEAGKSNVNGTNNIAIGAYALDDAANSHYNIAMGEGTLGHASMSGNYNLSIGNFSMLNNTTGHDNLGLGQNALGQNQTGHYNLAIGNYAADQNSSGSYNTAIGVESLGSSTASDGNTAVGYKALFSANSQQNTALGFHAGSSNISGSGNVFIGYTAGFAETGSNKLYISNSSTTTPLIYGDFSQKKLTINDSLSTKYLKVTVGAAAGKVFQSNSYGQGSWVEPNTLFEDVDNINIFMGQEVGQSVTTATDNTIIGSFAGTQLTEGYENTGFGKWSLLNITTADFNTAIGHNTLSSNQTGQENTALGWSALSGVTGSSNVGIGAAAGGENTSGSQNVYLGSEAGMNNTGSGNVFLGYRAGKNVSGSNKLNIDNSDTATPLIAGDFTTNEVTINDSLTVGKELGVATPTPNSTFEVNGSVAAKFKTPLVAGTDQPDGTGMVWRYNSGTGNINLPAAGTCPNRIYVIINQTGTTRTISTYRDLVTNNQTTIGSSVALWIMSDGSQWWQIK